MSVYRRPNQNNYFSSSRTWMQDYRLSCKAVGLLARMLSMPPDWEFHQSELVKKLIEGEDAIRAYMIELVKYGYLLKLPRNRNADGRWGDVTYEVWDIPQFKEPLSDKDAEKIFTHSYNEKDFKSIYNRDLPKPDFPDQVELDRADPGLQLKQEQEIEQKNKQTKQAVPLVSFSPLIEDEGKKRLLLSKFSLSEDFIKKILQFPIENYSDAIQLTLEEPRGNIEGFLHDAIMKKWKPNKKPPEDLFEENKQIAEEIYQKIIPNKPNNMYIEILSKKVEVGYIGCQKAPVEIEYSEIAFREKFVKLLKEHGIKID